MKQLHKEITKISNDGELLPAMFRAEAQFRNDCWKEKEDAEVAMKEAQKRAKLLEQEKLDLKHELERKEWLSNFAIGARNNMKDTLQEQI